MIDLNSFFDLMSFLFSKITDLSFVIYLTVGFVLPFILYSAFSYALRGSY